MRFHFYLEIDSRKIKWFFQRLFRGWSDAELWDLQYHLAKYIYPRLKAFIKSNRMGYLNLDGKSTSRQWEDILRKMLESFKKVSGGNFIEEDVQEGLELFGKYFLALWD